MDMPLMPSILIKTCLQSTMGGPPGCALQLLKPTPVSREQILCFLYKLLFKLCVLPLNPFPQKKN